MQLLGPGMACSLQLPNPKWETASVSGSSSFDWTAVQDPIYIHSHLRPGTSPTARSVPSHLRHSLATLSREFQLLKTKREEAVSPCAPVASITIVGGFSVFWTRTVGSIMRFSREADIFKALRAACQTLQRFLQACFNNYPKGRDFSGAHATG